MIRVADDIEGGGTLLPDLTPLLDVIFIMLVFLLLSANSVPRSLELELPEDAHQAASPTATAQSITVSLSQPAGQVLWSLDGEQLSGWDELTGAIIAAKTQSPERALIVEADRATPLNRFLQLMTWLQQQGYPAAHVLMQEAQ